VTRSEEEVSFKTRAAPRERVRLRQHVVTEHVEKTVPVRREEVRVETGPPQDGRVVDVRDAAED
jgi:stress response protein YsnF